MKKIALIIILLSIVIGVSAKETKDYLLRDSNMAITISRAEDNNVYISNITDTKSNTSFMTGNGKVTNLWTLPIKKHREYSSEEIILTPLDAKSLIIDSKTNKITITWKDVKKDFMTSGFDVIVTGEIKDANSYWDINIETKTKDYGIWTVKFPNIDTIDSKKGNTVLIPSYTGCISDNYVNVNTGEIGACYAGVPFQYFAVTKGENTLYMQSQDKKGINKNYSYNAADGDLDYYIRTMPDYMGVGGHNYKQGYTFIISVMNGDWFDVVKRYRKWSIENKMPLFSRGRIEDREDFPDWAKHTTLWSSENIDEYGRYRNDKINMAAHIYHWNTKPHDVGYPDFFPAKDNLAVEAQKYHDAKIPYIFYTNSHLVDKNNSSLYKKYGDYLLSVDENQKPYGKSWAKELGADNYSCCPNVPEYQETIINVEDRLVKEYNADGVYLDELSSAYPELCFNENHPHPVGGGDHWTKAHIKIIKDIVENAKKSKREPILVTGEAFGEIYPVDAYLNLATHPLMPPFSTYIVSGYAQSFGLYYMEDEYATEKSIAAINRAGVQLVWGFQLGWGWKKGSWDAYPEFGKYILGTIEAREAANKYFNLGEMVRPVKFKQEIPTINTFMWTSSKHIGDFPIIKTCSFYYKGETCVTFTNISPDNSYNLDWESKAKDLYLKEKASYIIKEIYPNNKEVFNNNKIQGQITLKPLETKVYVVK